MLIHMVSAACYGVRYCSFDKLLVATLASG
jgi:hypothetical protein